MTKSVFDAQIERLKVRFGERHFDPEFVQLASERVRRMADDRFIWQVNTWLGSKRPTDPPMLAEFEEAMLAVERMERKSESLKAARAFRAQNSKSVLEILKPFVGTVQSVAEAIEVRKHQIRIAKANDPNYDPMTDRKWMGNHAWAPKDPDGAA